MKSPRGKAARAGVRPRNGGPRKQRDQVSGERRDPELASDGHGPGKRRGRVALLLFALLFFVYLSNGMFLPGNDAVPNVRLPLQILDHGSLYFTPEQNPSMFVFSMETPEGKTPAKFRDWRATHEGRPVYEAWQAGKLTLSEPRYYLTSTIRPGKYASTFGIGAGLTALPVFAVVKLFVRNLADRAELLWQLGKIVAAMLVAGSAVFLFLAASERIGPFAAFLLAAAYGLGTCVWSTSSQALWQHGPCEFFMAVGAYFLLQKDRRLADALSGLAFGLAVLCRPTAALVVASVSVFHAIGDRSRFLRFVVGGLPVAVVALVYAQVTFGNPFSFGQLANQGLALEKTGNPSLWQTPLYVGGAGLLLSPGRGLLLYSPIAIFALWGLGRAFRDPVWRDLRALAVGAVALFLLSSKWFDWWGGWCFGYRPIVDTAILLAFVALPVVDRVRNARVLQATFTVLLAWSVGVQIIGAFAYDVDGWNGGLVYDVSRPGTDTRITFEDRASAIRHARDHGGGTVIPRMRDIDSPEGHDRLWSLSDSPLRYYYRRFAEGKEARRRTVQAFLDDSG